MIFVCPPSLLRPPGGSTEHNILPEPHSALCPWAPLAFLLNTWFYQNHTGLAASVRTPNNDLVSQKQRNMSSGANTPGKIDVVQKALILHGVPCVIIFHNNKLYGSPCFVFLSDVFVPPATSLVSYE